MASSTSGLASIPADMTEYVKNLDARPSTNSFFAEYQNQIYNYKCSIEQNAVKKARNCNCTKKNKNSPACIRQKEMKAAKVLRRMLNNSVTNNYPSLNPPKNPVVVTDSNIQNAAISPQMSASIANDDATYNSAITADFTETELSFDMPDTKIPVGDGKGSTIGRPQRYVTYSSA